LYCGAWDSKCWPQLYPSAEEQHIDAVLELSYLWQINGQICFCLVVSPLALHGLTSGIWCLMLVANRCMVPSEISALLRWLQSALKRVQYPAVFWCLPDSKCWLSPTFLLTLSYHGKEMGFTLLLCFVIALLCSTP
jgi:hypothetical protein